MILHNTTAKRKNYTEFTKSSTFPYQFYTTRYYRFSVTDFEQSKFTWKYTSWGSFCKTEVLRNATMPKIAHISFLIIFSLFKIRRWLYHLRRGKKFVIDFELLRYLKDTCEKYFSWTYKLLRISTTQKNVRLHITC